MVAQIQDNLLHVLTVKIFPFRCRLIKQQLLVIAMEIVNFSLNINNYNVSAGADIEAPAPEEYKLNRTGRIDSHNFA